jgi:GNAT superfamily N-acetyltransferase
MNQRMSPHKYSESWQIRVAAPTDVDALLGLSVQLGYPAAGELIHKRVESILALEHHALLVAVSHKGPLWGWVHVFERPLLVQALGAELGGLVVDQTVRRQGIGRGLLAAAEQWVQSRGLSHLTLRSNTIRVEAHEFYRRLGYQRQKTSYTFRKEIGVRQPSHPPSQ